MKSDLVNKIVLAKAVKESARLMEIQMIVWRYMEMPKDKRDGILMAMEISKLFEKNENSNCQQK